MEHSIQRGHPLAQFNGKAVERLVPIVDRHRPLFDDPFQRQIVKFEQRFLVRKNPSVLADLAQRPRMVKKLMRPPGGRI